MKIYTKKIHYSKLKNGEACIYLPIIGKRRKEGIVDFYMGMSREDDMRIVRAWVKRQDGVVKAFLEPYEVGDRKDRERAKRVVLDKIKLSLENNENI